LEAAYSWGRCCSAGGTAGMASLAACSTQEAARWSAPTGHGIGVSRGRWVKGAKAGWKAGRHTWECLIHNWRLALLLRTVGTQWECKPGDLRS
jgi:hypothetical protein